MLTRRRLRSREESGMTLMELMVTMAVMSVVLAILFGIIDQTSRVVVRGDGDVQSENSLQLAMRTMSQDIRAANQLTFTSATAGACPSAPTSANCLSFVVSHDSTSYPKCQTAVTYGLVTDSSTSSLTGSKITRTTKQTNCSTNVSGSRSVLTNVSGASLFTYYDSGDKVLTTGQSGASSIQISLAVVYIKGGTPVTLSGFVALRNSR